MYLRSTYFLRVCSIHVFATDDRRERCEGRAWRYLQGKRCLQDEFLIRVFNQNLYVHYRRTIARIKLIIARLGRSWPVSFNPIQCRERGSQHSSFLYHRYECTVFTKKVSQEPRCVWALVPSFIELHQHHDWFWVVIILIVSSYQRLDRLRTPRLGGSGSHPSRGEVRMSTSPDGVPMCQLISENLFCRDRVTPVVCDIW